jgi:hypothetical protein
MAAGEAGEIVFALRCYGGSSGGIGVPGIAHFLLAGGGSDGAGGSWFVADGSCEWGCGNQLAAEIEPGRAAGCAG